MTVKLVDNKQDKPSNQIWRWNWLTTNKTNQTRWLMTSEFVCLDGITSSSVSCWEQQSLTRKIVLDWLMWKMLHWFISAGTRGRGVHFRSTLIYFFKHCCSLLGQDRTFFFMPHWYGGREWGPLLVFDPYFSSESEDTKILQFFRDTIGFFFVSCWYNKIPF